MHPQHGDKSITIEDDTPENRALIASHLKEYQNQGFLFYVTLTEKREVKKGIFFKKTVLVDQKISYRVKDYDEKTNEWILDTESIPKQVPPKETRVAMRTTELTTFRPVCGG